MIWRCEFNRKGTNRSSISNNFFSLADQRNVSNVVFDFANVGVLATISNVLNWVLKSKVGVASKAQENERRIAFRVVRIDIS